MGNVWDAMRRHEAEQAASEAQSPVASEEYSEAPSPEQQDVATAVEDLPAAPPGGRAHQPEAGRSAGATGDARASDGYDERLVAYRERGHRITEDYREARINLLRQAEGKKLCCLITSANPDEGKTVTCANLAVVLAEREERTIVVDGDLRKADLARMFNAKNSPGVVDVLRGSVSPKEAVQGTALPNLFLMPAGEARTQEVGKLLARPELEELFHQLRRDYDYVLIDTPPINKTPDANMIGSFARHAIIVVRMNRTHRESVDKARRSLENADIRVSGIILTARTYHIPRYLYHYGYRDKYKDKGGA